MLNQIAIVPAVVSQELSYTIPRFLQGNMMEKSIVPIVNMQDYFAQVKAFFSGFC
jgi:hypothetical protein